LTNFELTIAKDYVAEWGVAAAIRELFQNAIDSKKRWYSKYEDGILSIITPDTQLSTSTLILGCTTKLNDSDAIGQYGEGYKLALLVLTRMGYTVKVYTGNECWSTRFKQSRRFDNTPILTIDVEKTRVKYVDLIFSIELPEDVYQSEVVDKTLFLHDHTVVMKDDTVEVLEEHKLYVSGLYVMDLHLMYGYNFYNLKLNRDRNSISDFDLLWRTSEFWGKHVVEATKLIFSSIDDVRYINYLSSSDFKQEILEYFYKTYGASAYPVVTESDRSRVPTGYTGVVVSPLLRTLCCDAKDFPALRPDPESTNQRIIRWAKKLQVSSDDYDELISILGE